MTRRFWLETYGCQMNKAESGALVLRLEEAGWTEAARPAEADCVILNTCAVRQTAENRIWGRIGFFRHLRAQTDFKLIVMGCMTQRLQQKFWEQAPDIDLLVGSFEKDSLPGALEEILATDQKKRLTEVRPYRFEPRHSNAAYKAFVPIMHGCNNYCSYCIVPYVRGPEVSRSPEAVIQEVRDLAAGHVREVTLLGQNVNSYRCANGSVSLDFPKLLCMIVETVPDIPRIRFLTSHPKDLSPELIRVIGEHPRICRHIHLPVQHGSTKILRAMARGYSRDDYLRLVSRIRDSITNVSLTTDILIGFPGESEADFEQTLELMEEVRFNDAYTYKYNPREGTAAFRLGDTVPEETKLRRLARIIDLQHEITRQEKTHRLGSRTDVLVESRSKKNASEMLGRTEWDDMVVFPCAEEKTGSLTRVELLALAGSTFKGREVDDPCLGV